MMSRSFSCRVLSILLLQFSVLSVDAVLVQEWTLFPSYRLPEPNSRLHSIPEPLPEGLFEDLSEIGAKTYRGNLPTHRWFPETTFRSDPPFTVELLTFDHSHYPTGVVLYGTSETEAGGFHVGYYDNAVDVGNGVTRVFVPSEWRSAYNRYWRHIVLTVDASGTGSVYVNGDLEGTLEWSTVPDCSVWEVAAYNAQDPLMRIENILHRMRYHSGSVDAGEARDMFLKSATAVYNGWRFPGHFHFIAGPAISYVSTTEAYLVVEADRSTRARLYWGLSENQLDEKVEIPVLRGLHTIPLRNLSAGTEVFYKIELEDAAGDEISTATLSFTVPEENPEHVRFGVVGDTESRPWINNEVAKRLWESVPDFVVHLGDITDNGEKGRKPQWTHEYFSGMEQLQSRVPVFAVPGNGEDDNLYWYQRYFPAPRDQGNSAGYFRFSWGMVDFFMLDSNERAREFQEGGRQYAWLDEQLSSSEARWKIVCFHHPGPPGTYGDDASVNGLVPLYEKHGVHLVLNGHKHTYERSKPRLGGQIDEAGVVYIICGGAGGNLKDEEGAFAISRFTETVYRNYNYMVFDVSETVLEARMFGLDGVERDRLVLGETDKAWLTAFPRGLGPVEGWIYDLAIGWVFVDTFPWCYVPKTVRSHL